MRLKVLSAPFLIASGFAIALWPAIGFAKYDVNRAEPDGKTVTSGKTARTAAACLPATSTAELNINNTRALLHNGGDMWWDLVGQPRYEIPKVDNPANAKHSMFASSLWIGGFDGSGQLRIAAQTYRQSGNDFYPGPITIDGTASTEREICNQWDRHFSVTKAEIDAFRSDFDADGTVDLGQYPNVRDWPGNNPNPDFEFQLAPFVDQDGDGVYEPDAGDFPLINGDQAIWWVINDKGDIHTETGGEQIGVEIHMLAFAFATSNEVNNMTFYRETVFNRSTNTLNDCYIGQWVDADLGFFADDYVMCDTIRGLGICYNGDNNDDPPNGYGLNPPAIGVDFFQGPFSDPGDGLDNDRDGEIDELDSLGNTERIGMAKFIYYNNDFSIRGNPTTAQHFYGYLSGFWRNGAAIVDDRTGNGNGFPDPGETVSAANFMFPDFPNQCASGNCANVSYTASGQPWDEKCVGNDPFDRRFVQSAGPFTLAPGATNEIVVGVVWARDETAGDELGSVCKLLAADDVAQALFDNNFDLVDGPDAPDLRIEEFDRELVLAWEYSNLNSNNRFENYQEDDVTITDSTLNPTYRFEGYIVYQLLDETVSASELNDPTRARVIAQCDIDNDVSTIVNRTTTSIPGSAEDLITDEVMVEGSNQGLFHSVRILDDAFAEGSNKRLVNYRDYYFTVIAYAHNGDAPSLRFITGNGNFSTQQATPHETRFEDFGLTLNSAYGDSPIITMVSGFGNGGRFTRLDSTEAEIVVRNGSAERVYQAGAAPIQVEVVNPKEVLDKKYRVVVVEDSLIQRVPVVNPATKLVDTLDVYADWFLYEIDRATGAIIDQVYTSEWAILRIVGGIQDTQPRPLDGSQKVISGHGIAIRVGNPEDVGSDPTGDETNGIIGSEQAFLGESPSWLTGLNDFNNFAPYNWIRAGDSPLCVDGDDCSGGLSCIDGQCIDVSSDEDLRNFTNVPTYRSTNNFDPNGAFEELVNGTWAPYVLSAHFHTAKDIIGPRLRVNSDALSSDNNLVDIRRFKPLSELNNVDIVLTSNPDLWSRCLVVESSPNQDLSFGAWPLAPRYRPSMALNGCELVPGPDLPPNPDTTQRYSLDYGYSYFPGYAIDVDRGVRLNLFFAESAWNREFNGDDMLFNPTEDFGADGKAVGGRHYVYITDQAYDGCEALGAYRMLNYQPIVDQPTAYIFFNNGEKPDSLVGLYENVTWAGIPLLGDNQFAFSSYCNLPGEVRISLRVNNSFKDDTTGNAPAFEFDMGSQAAELNVQPVAEESFMEDIRVVPNPYYGRSGTGRGSYELSQLDNRVKITNLPQRCTLRIFTLNGQLVRVFRKDSDEPDLEWDLKNSDGVPIASGLYVIHVDGGELGERVIKFYGIISELDLSRF